MIESSGKSEIWLRAALTEADLAGLERFGSNHSQPGHRIFATDGGLAPVTEAIRHLLPQARPVRCIAFSKDATNDWGLGWHQDRVIAVDERHDLAGYSNWGRKSGVWHCEPPLAILESMRFVRVHLDDCDESNGAMVIALGSHALGRVTDRDADHIAGQFSTSVCKAARGDIQILPMLTLHRSGNNGSGAPRRALRIDYATADLPLPLRWTEALL